MTEHAVVRINPEPLIDIHTRHAEHVARGVELIGPPCTRFGLEVLEFRPASLVYALWAHTGPDRGDAIIIEGLLRNTLGADTMRKQFHPSQMDHVANALYEYATPGRHILEAALGPNWAAVADVVRQAALCGELSRLRVEEQALGTTIDATANIARTRAAGDAAAANNLHNAMRFVGYLVDPYSQSVNYGPGRTAIGVAARNAAKAALLGDLLDAEVSAALRAPWERIVATRSAY